MPNPNIVNVGNIFGKTFQNVVSTANALQVVNESGSSNVFKINSIMVSNILTGNNNGDISIEINNAAGNGTARKLANTITVPASSTLIVSDKNTSFYLESDMSIKANTSVNNSVHLTISYEVIS